MEWRNVFFGVGIICLLFFGIPMKVKKQPGNTEKLFQAFVARYNKHYHGNATEYAKRLAVFQESLDIINKLNSNRTADGAYYGVTQFSDLSLEEFHKLHLRQKRQHHTQYPSKFNKRYRRASTGITEKFDWRSRNVITSVRNQKTCGACWAFSTVETVESMNALKNRTLQALSVQQIIDCAGNGNNGCDGGDSKLLLEWLLTTKTAIEPESKYPFTYSTDFCKYKSAATGVQVNAFSCKNLVGGESAILDLLTNHGPVAVAVNAANWQFYLGGVIQYHCPGAVTDLNHAVQLVGFDNTAPTPFYIVRNSWGVDFGDSGYLYLSIGNNICGLANEVCSLDVV